MRYCYLSALTALILSGGTFFICDTHLTPDPGAEELAEMTVLAAEEVRRFGLVPKVALISHSSFGTHQTPSAAKVRTALRLLHERAPELEADGEMRVDEALSDDLRRQICPDSKPSGQAKLLVMPNLDAANSAYGLLRMSGGGVAVGPVLTGAALPVHVVTPSITVRGLVNMSALAVAQAQQLAKQS